MDEKQAPQLSAKTRRIFRVFTLFFALLISLVIGEICTTLLTSEVFLQTRLRDGGVLIPFKPMAEAELVMDEFHTSFKINQFGHRDKKDRRATKKAGTKRVLVLGDSFSAGWGVEFEDIYASQLEKNMAVEFVNGAKSGGCALWYLHQARYGLKQFQPDAIVVQIFDNDVADYLRDKKAFNVQEDQPVGALPMDLDPRQTGTMKALTGLFNKLTLRRKIRNLRRKLIGKTIHRQPYSKIGTTPRREPLSRQQVYDKRKDQIVVPPKWSPDFQMHDPGQWSAWEKPIAEHNRVLLQLIEECQKAKKPIFIVYIPCPQLFMRDRTGQDIVRTNRFSKSLKDLCQSKNVPYLDPTLDFTAAYKKPQELYFIFDNHLNPKGHKALATVLEKSLKPFLGRIK
jgi:lysophospholipase L1-like esterase